MLREISIGQYVAVDSPVHRLDPRTKILITVLYMVVIFAAGDWRGYLMLAALAAAAVHLSRIPPGLITRGLKPVVILLLFTLALNVFMTRGEVIWRLGPLAVSREGLVQGFFLSIRLLLLVGMTSLLTLTTAPISLADGLEALLRPFARVGVPAHELAMMITIALRFIPTLLEEADKIIKAQMARGADFGRGGLVQRARALLPLLVPLFVSAFRRADELATAMEARAYRGGVGRTRMKQLRLAARDLAAGAVAAAVAAAVIATRWWA